MEYAAHGDLQKYLEAMNTASARLPLSLLLRLALDISSALRFCHSKGLIHRDVKAMNVCVTEDLRAKVMDFGLSRFLDAGHSIVTGVQATYQYSAPEIIDEDLGDGTVRPSCDVYSFGVVLWEMLSGKRPWEGLRPNQVILAVSKGKELVVPGEWDMDKRSLVARCLARDQAARPTFEEIHALLRDMHEREVTRLHELQSAPPFSFYCPISQEVLIDPVCTDDGHTYERGNIEHWLASHNTSPVTNAVLPNKTLRPNHALKSIIAEWQERQMAMTLPPPSGYAPVEAVPPDAGKQLYLASELGDLEAVRKMGEKWGEKEEVVNFANPEERVVFGGWRRTAGMTALFAASTSGRTEVVNALVSLPIIEVNKSDSNGRTPLFAACFNNSTDVVEVLVSLPSIDVNKADNFGLTPLLVACINGHADVVKVLVSLPGIDINKADKDGRTPLYAASQGNGWTPLQIANKEEIRAILQAKGAR